MYCGTLAAAGYCPVHLGNLALSASERMKQFLDKETWKDHVTRCVQSLDDSSVVGCPLPWCTTPWKGVLRRRFHLQDGHCVEFSQGTKRDRPDIAAGDKGTSIISHGKRRCVNQASPNLDKALLPTAGCHFINETVETIKSRSLSQTPQGETLVQRKGQSVTSEPGLTILDDGSSSTSATYLSTRGTEDRSPDTPFTDLCPESFDNLLDPGLLSSNNSTSRSPFPASSDNINTPQGDDEYGDELPSLHSLLNLNSTSSSSDSSNTKIQKGLTAPTLQIQGWTEVPGPGGIPILQERSDHEPDALRCRYR
jgi:hypothetical protein